MTPKQDSIDHSFHEMAVEIRTDLKYLRKSNDEAFRRGTARMDKIDERMAAEHTVIHSRLDAISARLRSIEDWKTRTIAYATVIWFVATTLGSVVGTILVNKILTP